MIRGTQSSCVVGHVFHFRESVNVSYLVYIRQNVGFLRRILNFGFLFSPTSFLRPFPRVSPILESDVEHVEMRK